MQADLPGDRIDVLIEPLLQIDDPVGSELADRIPGLGIERHELIAGRDVEDARAGRISPIGQATPREPARRFLTALPFIEAIEPQLLVRRGIERDHRTAAPRRRVQHAIRHKGRALKVELRSRTQIAGLEPPGHLEFVEILPGDLVERRIAVVREVAPVGHPFALCAFLTRDLHAREHEQRHR